MFCFILFYQTKSLFNSISRSNSHDLKLEKNQILTPLNPAEFQFKIGNSQNSLTAKAFYCKSGQCDLHITNPSTNEDKIFAYSISYFNNSCQEFSLFTNIDNITFIVSNSDYITNTEKNYTIKKNQDICLYFGSVYKYVVSLKYDLSQSDFISFDRTDITGNSVQLVVTDLHSLYFHTGEETNSKYVDILINKWSTNVDEYTGKLSVGKVSNNEIITINDNSFSYGIELSHKQQDQQQNQNEYKPKTSMRSIIIYTVAPGLMFIVLVICAVLLVFLIMKNNNEEKEENSDSDTLKDLSLDQNSKGAARKNLFDGLTIDAPVAQPLIPDA